MERVIVQPTQYQGDAYINLGSALVPWAFVANQDMEFATSNDLNASAQVECDYSFRFVETGITNDYGVNIWQQFTNPGFDHTAWQYDICLQYTSDIVGILAVPFICQMEDVAANSTRFNFLPCSHSPIAVANGSGSMKASGTVIRDKHAISGAEDSNNIAFGVLIVNHGGAAAEVTGLGSLSVHPNSQPLKLDKPG